MKIRYSNFLVGVMTFFIGSLFSLFNAPGDNSAGISEPNRTSRHVLTPYTAWKSYLDEHEIRPQSLKLSERMRGGREIFEIGKHRIESDLEQSDSLKINGEKVIVNGVTTRNKVWHSTGEVFAQSVIDVRLYRHRDKEILGFSFFYNCAGRSCQYSQYLFYDLSTKKKSFFITYCAIEIEQKLYDFGRDGKIEFLASSFEGEQCSEKHEVSLKAYEISSDRASGTGFGCGSSGRSDGKCQKPDDGIEGYVRWVNSWDWNEPRLFVDNWKWNWRKSKEVEKNS